LSSILGACGLRVWIAFLPGAGNCFVAIKIRRFDEAINKKLHTPGPYDCLWDIEPNEVAAIMWSRRIIKAVTAAGLCYSADRARLLIFPLTFWRAAVGRRLFDLPTSEVNPRSN
jgi:hypothetical protein